MLTKSLLSNINRWNYFIIQSLKRQGVMVSRKIGPYCIGRPSSMGLNMFDRYVETERQWGSTSSESMEAVLAEFQSPKLQR